MKNVKDIAITELKDINYITAGMIDGFIADVFDKANVPKVNPIPQDYFEDIKEAICDEFHNGCEPEFETEEDYLRFEAIHSNNYEYVVNARKTPYLDKTIPYLKKIKK